MFDFKYQTDIVMVERFLAQTQTFVFICKSRWFLSKHSKHQVKCKLSMKRVFVKKKNVACMEAILISNSAWYGDETWCKKIIVVLKKNHFIVRSENALLSQIKRHLKLSICSRF
jgi:hypothetical protein